MTKVRSKRKRPRPWVLTFRRAVGEFKNGERSMMEIGGIMVRDYTTEKLAIRGKCRPWRDPYRPFIYRKGAKPKKIIELQIWPDGYHDE